MTEGLKAILTDLVETNLQMSYQMTKATVGFMALDDRLPSDVIEFINHDEDLTIILMDDICKKLNIHDDKSIDSIHFEIYNNTNKLYCYYNKIRRELKRNEEQKQTD